MAHRNIGGGLGKSRGRRGRGTCYFINVGRIAEEHILTSLVIGPECHLLFVYERLCKDNPRADT
jgi:hypothetical protein